MSQSEFSAIDLVGHDTSSDCLTDRVIESHEQLWDRFTGAPHQCCEHGVFIRCDGSSINRSNAPEGDVTSARDECRDV